MKKVYEIFFKKVVLSLVLTGFAMVGSATVYYVSNSGNDTNSGLTSSLPWKTLAKVNATAFKAGDQILFQRGSVFYGSLTIKYSGTSGSPIVFGAYGTGENPMISGFTAVASWNNLGSNIWESTSAVTALSAVNMVAVNGENTPMGRYPNSSDTNGGYLSFQSHVGNTSITSSSLSGTPDWTGAEVVVRPVRWILNRRKILSQAGGTLNFSALSYVPIDGFGFFIQNDVRTLDKQNEWYFDPATKKLKIYSTGAPAGVNVATLNNLVVITGSYLTIENISFEGSDGIAITGDATLRSNIKIQNCRINNIGGDAISGLKADNSVLDGNIVSNVNNNGIGVNGVSNLIQNNSVSNVGLFPGMGSLIYMGITAGSSTTIQYNTVQNVGYIGISFYGNDVLVKNNFVNGFCSILDDGGGIYTYTGTRTAMRGCKVIENIVINGFGTKSGSYQAYGIYLDNDTEDVLVEKNATAYCGAYGYYMHDNTNVRLTNNIAFSNSVAQCYFQDDYGDGTVINNEITNNVFVSGQNNTFTVQYRSIGATINQGGTWNYNRYVQITNPTNPIRTGTSIQVYGNYTLNWWQTFSGQDGNSLIFMPFITNVNNIIFEYNNSQSTRTISLSQPMIDVTGAKYATSITLQPYSSVVLMKDPNPAKYTTEYKSICEGSNYNGWTVTGKYERTLIAKSGVDSIVTTFLNVNPKYAVSEDITINSGESYKTWTTSGTYTQTLSSKFGCDSIVTTNLTVESLKTGSINTTQTIELKKGYNMISTYVAAIDPAVSTVTQPIVDSGYLIKIQDEAGNSYENWGSFGGWINNLGTIKSTEGYKVKVAENCTLQITGLPVALPLDIPLNAGWNIISFPRTDAIDAMTIIQPLINQNKLIKVQDEAGNSIEDWGIYGGWKNGIGNFVPGKAYRVKLSSSATLTIQDTYAKSAVIPVYAEKTSYFSSETEGNGLDHMNINIVGLRESGIVAGDELAAFDGNVCIGTLKVTDYHLSQGSVSLIASAATGSTQKDGFKDGSPVEVFLWKQNQNAESKVELSSVSGGLTYVKNASIMVKMKSIATSVAPVTDELSISVYPNPSKGRFTVQFSSMPENGGRIEVLDLSGRKLVSQQVGGIAEEINLTGQASGLYLVKSLIGSVEKIHKLVIQ